MAKKRSSPLKRREAETIAHKLSDKSDIAPGGRHIRAKIRYNGEVIGQFGWSHDRQEANGHIPRELRISQHDTLEMARCNIDYDGYIALLKKKNLLPSS